MSSCAAPPHADRPRPDTCTSRARPTLRAPDHGSARPGAQPLAAAVRQTVTRGRCAQLREVHVREGRSGLEAPHRFRALSGQAGVRRRMPRVRRRALPAHLLPGGHARGLRPHGEGDRAPPGADPRTARAAEPERADEVRRGGPLLPGDDQGVALQRRARSPGRASPGRRLEVLHPVPDVEEAGVVRPPGGRACPDHARPHRGGQALYRDRDQHGLLIRARRPGVRCGLRR